MRVFKNTKTPEEEFKHYGALGYSGAYNDRLFEYLGDRGYTGALNDRLYSAYQKEIAGKAPLDSWDFSLDVSHLPLTRSSTGTYVDEDGNIQTAAINEPRYDYSTGSRALLMEGQATNLLLSSEDIAGSDWSKTDFGTSGNAPTVSSSHGVAPDGTMTADLVSFDAVDASGQSSIGNAAAFNVTGDAVFSVWLRASSGFEVVRLRIDYDGGATSINFTIDSIWRRYTIAAESQNNIDYVSVKLRPSTGTSTAADVYVWGTQVEGVNSVANPSVWLEGDSYMAGASDSGIFHSLAEAIQMRSTNATSTAVGGSTMEQITARIEANAATYSGRHLYVWDGSANGFTSAPDIMAQLARIDAAHTGDWTYIPPLVHDIEGDGPITGVQAREIRDTAIANGYNVIDPWPLMWSLSDGSAQDEADVAEGLVPSSLYFDEVHLYLTALYKVADLIVQEALNASSYIPTNGAAATRAADIATVDVSGLDLSDGFWVVLKGLQLDGVDGSSDRLIQLGDSSNLNALVYSTGASSIQAIQRDSGSITALESFSYTLGGAASLAVKFRQDDFEAVWPDGSTATDTSASFVTPSNLFIAAADGSGTSTPARTLFEEISIYPSDIAPEQMKLALGL